LDGQSGSSQMPRRQRQCSKTKPAKLLAVFVVDTNEPELTIPLGN